MNRKKSLLLSAVVSFLLVLALSVCGYTANNTRASTAEAPMRGYVLDAQGAILPESFLVEAGLAPLVDENLAAGNNIRLTLDSELQKAAEDSLVKAFHSQPDMIGAVVVMDMEGQILALADNQKRESVTIPLALTVHATPGRTLLPLTALTALSTGALDVNEKISDMGQFDLYDKGKGPRCWIDPSRFDLHQNQNVVDALSNGCDSMRSRRYQGRVSKNGPEWREVWDWIVRAVLDFPANCMAW